MQITLVNFISRIKFQVDSLFSSDNLRQCGPKIPRCLPRFPICPKCDSVRKGRQSCFTGCARLGLGEALQCRQQRAGTVLFRKKPFFSCLINVGQPDVFNRDSLVGRHWPMAEAQQLRYS
jgi:hypothetical protein